MKTKVSYAAVGLFVLVLGAALIMLALFLSAGTFERKIYDTYYAYVYESVSGLSRNSAVKYRGVEVGKVRDIALDPDNSERVRLILDIERGTPVKEDTVAVLVVQGLTGLAFIDLTGGSQESPPLKSPDGGTPVIHTGPSLFTRMDAALSGALDNFNQLTADLRGMLDEENRVALHDTLQHIRTITAGLAAQQEAMQAALKGFAVMAENTAQASDDLPQVLQTANQSMAAMGDIARDLSRLTQSLEQTVHDNRAGVDTFTQQTLPEIGQLVQQMQTLTQSLQRLTRQLERDPARLLYGDRDRVPGPGE